MKQNKKNTKRYKVLPKVVMERAIISSNEIKGSNSKSTFRQGSQIGYGQKQMEVGWKRGDSQGREM